MSWHAAPFPSHTCHWYWNVIGVEPFHVPGLAVSVLPAVFVPPVVGSEAFVGATAARVVIAAAVPTATSATAADDARQHAAAPAVGRPQSWEPGHE